MEDRNPSRTAWETDWISDKNINAATSPKANGNPIFADPESFTLSAAPYFTTYGIKARKRARLMALANSRCFLAETAVMRDGTILPRSDT